MDGALFVNLPVSDLAASTAFYEALGFRHEPDYSSDTVACMVIGEALFLMLLTRGQFEEFAGRPMLDSRSGAAAFHMLARPDRAAVDAMIAAAIAHGGEELGETEDTEHMYARQVADRDGHIWEFTVISMETAG